MVQCPRRSVHGCEHTRCERVRVCVCAAAGSALLLHAVLSYCCAVLTRCDSVANLVVNCPIATTLAAAVKTGSLPATARTLAATALAIAVKSALYVQPAVLSDKV